MKKKSTEKLKDFWKSFGNDKKNGKLQDSLLNDKQILFLWLKIDPEALKLTNSWIRKEFYVAKNSKTNVV